MLYKHCSLSASPPPFESGWDAENEQCIYNIAHYLHLNHHFRKVFASPKWNLSPQMVYPTYSKIEWTLVNTCIIYINDKRCTKMAHVIPLSSTQFHIPYPLEYKTGIQDGLISKLEGKKSVLYSRLSNFYVGIRQFIFKFLVLYSRLSYTHWNL